MTSHWRVAVFSYYISYMVRKS